MAYIIEISSQIAGILSFILAFIGLIFIKPISNHFKNIHKSSNSINENNAGATYNIGGDFINKKILIKDDNNELTSNSN